MIRALLLAAALAAPEVARAADERWVTLGAGVTETVFALGGGGQVVAVDASSVVPPAADLLPEVGSLHHVSAEAILAVRPTRVFVSAEVGPPDALAQVSAAGVQVIRFPEIHDLDGARARLRALATATGAPAAGERLVARLDATLAALPAPASRPRVVFVYARGAGTLMLAGRGSGVDAIVEAAGAVFPATWQGYRPVTAEALVVLAPDVLLLTTRGHASLSGSAGLLDVPGVQMTPAGRAQRVVVMDDLLLLGMGPRTGDAVRALHDALARWTP